MTSKDDDFWNSGAQTSFNFDDDEEVSFNEDASKENSSNAYSNQIFGSLDEVDTLPIHQIISKKSLDLILEDVHLPEIQATVSSIEETVKKAFLGKSYVLSNFKSIDEKSELLNQAINTNDGNIILAVTLYLLKTLKRSIFLRIINGNKTAVRHYEMYLRENNKFQDLGDLYITRGNYILDVFYLSCKHTNASQIKSKLEQFMIEYSSMIQTDKEIQLLNDYLLFLNWQLKTEVLCETVTEALSILSKTNWERNKDDSRILEFRSDMKIGDFQFEWIYLNTMAVLLMWKKLTEYFIKPNWLTKKSSLKSVIDLDLILLTLHKHQAPKKVLEDFLTCMVDVDRSIYLAKKWNCHRFVIDTYLNQKDRLALIDYIKEVNPQSEDFFYAKNALKTEKKWKN